MKVQINPKYAELQEFIYSLPELFPKYGEVIYEARNTIKTFKVNGMIINVKSFKKPILINRFVYKYIRKSKAERSFNYATRLLENDIQTPEPIAYIEIDEKGLLSHSYYISIHEPVDGTIRDIYSNPVNESKDLLRAFTVFTAELHNRGIFHKDYSPGNILYKKDGDKYRFYLVDLNRIEFKRINILKGCKNFCRIPIDKNMLENIVKEYSAMRKYNKSICEKLINYYNQSFWKKHLYRHPEVIDEDPCFQNLNLQGYR